MSAEMIRWKGQADAAAAAVREAKDELMERKKELDSTKEKMDHLARTRPHGSAALPARSGGGGWPEAAARARRRQVEKLYIGRERGLELRGAIDFHLERYKAVRLQDAVARSQFAAGVSGGGGGQLAGGEERSEKGEKGREAAKKTTTAAHRQQVVVAKAGAAAPVPAKAAAKVDGGGKAAGKGTGWERGQK